MTFENMTKKKFCPTETQDQKFKKKMIFIQFFVLFFSIINEVVFGLKSNLV
jgi:hypothetical protein